MAIWMHLIWRNVFIVHLTLQRNCSSLIRRCIDQYVSIRSKDDRRQTSIWHQWKLKQFANSFWLFWWRNWDFNDLFVSWRGFEGVDGWAKCASPLLSIFNARKVVADLSVLSVIWDTRCVQWVQPRIVCHNKVHARSRLHNGDTLSSWCVCVRVVCLYAYCSAAVVVVGCHRTSAQSAQHKMWFAVYARWSYHNDPD